MRVTVQNLTNSLLSTDVGLLQPAESRSLNMGPEAAYRASEGLKTLSDAGKVLVTIEEESAKLDNLEPAAVGTASVADGAITTVKLDDDVLSADADGRAKMEDAFFNEATVDAKFASGAIDSDRIKDASIGAAQLAASAVTKAKALVFASTEQTGTGSAQNVAHGLAATPSLVLVAVTESDGNAFDVAEGTHTSTNVVVTVTTGVKFKVLAWA